MSKRSYERRLKAKRMAEKEARRRAGKMRKIRIGSSIAGAAAVAVVILLLVLNSGDGTKPSVSPTGSSLPGCTTPTPAPTPNGKKFTTAPAMSIDSSKIYEATFQTSCGTIKMRMDPKSAPASVNNFVFLARQQYFDGTTIPRVQNSPNFQIIQAGSQTGTISGGVDYSYAGETPAPGSKYTRGVVAMANSQGPSTNGSQFFFVMSPSTPALDQNANYSIFGKVEDATSLATLDRILSAQGPRVDPQSDLGITPQPPIHILTVTIAEVAR